MKTFREKNNESRRKCYNKKKEDELWETFEHFSIDYHRNKYNHTTWHWNDVPEDYLNNAGFIHDFNKHRLRRISLYNNSEIINKYKDYGLDGLSLDPKGVYHGIQAKCYFSKKVSANDIGTFQSVIVNRLCNRCNDSKGYLYTINDIETNLLEDISNGKVYNYEKISLEEKEIVKNTEIKEDMMSLWRHQTEALEVLKDKEGLNLLSIICGTGKTVIAGHHLKTLEYETIVCIAPLRVSVEQLQIRLTPFLDDKETLLVDSDSKGTTDVDIVEKFLKSKNKKIIFSTFDSAINVLDKLLEERSYLVCDEVHNTVNNTEICNFINSFENGLLLTATPPEELLEQIDTVEIYKYSLADAIKDKLVCDYTVWLPYDITYDKIPKEINSMNKVDNDLILKSVFLSNGMLKTGSRRCIVYCKNRQECDDFCYAINTILREYHGIDSWIEKIDCETTSKKRLDILTNFQSGNNDKFYILTSVRILDEAVDIKKCDSEFITYIGDRKNDIRLVQRLMRGSRIDSENPNKHNNLFIWANDEDKNLFGILSLLKEIDPNFHKKVKIISKDYDKQEKMKKKIETKEMVLEKGLSVKCISLDELWEIRCQAFFRDVDNEGKIPNIRSKYGGWYNKQRQKATLNNFFFDLLSRNEIVKKDIIRYLKKKDITLEDKFNLWLELIIENNDLADSKYITEDGICIGSFQTCLFTSLSGKSDIYKNLLKEWKKKIEKLPDNIREQIQKRVDNKINNSKNKLSLDEKFELWKKLVIENNGLIPSHYKNGDIYIGSFQDTLIVGLSGKESKYKSFLDKWKQEIEQFPEEVKNQINLRIKRRLETITIEDKLKIWKEEVLKNKGLIDKKLTINDHIKIGYFQTILLSTLAESNKDYKQYIESWTKEINSFPKNIKIEILEKIKTYKVIDIDLKFNLWKEEVLKNNKLIEQNFCVVNEEDNVIRLGYFQNRLLKVLSGNSNLYPTYISKWKQEIKQFPDEIKNEINLRIKNS